jgi:hypothetical protein
MTARESSNKAAIRSRTVFTLGCAMMLFQIVRGIGLRQFDAWMLVACVCVPTVHLWMAKEEAIRRVTVSWTAYAFISPYIAVKLAHAAQH